MVSRRAKRFFDARCCTAGGIDELRSEWHSNIWRIYTNDGNAAVVVREGKLDTDPHNEVSISSEQQRRITSQ
jgi:hypothetical protein